MFERRQPSQIDADMTPMVDVTFLLLVFFMIASSMTTVSVLGAPHEPQDRWHVGPAARSVEILVDGNDVIFVNGDRVEPDGDLAGQIELAMADPEVDRSVMVETDHRSRHSSTIRVLDAARHARVHEIRYRSAEAVASEYN